MKKIMISAATTAALLGAGLGPITSADAAPAAAGARAAGSVTAAEGSTSSVTQPGLTPAIIARFDRYVHLVGGEYQVAAPSSVLAADPAGARQVRAAVTIANAELAAGEATPAGSTSKARHGSISTHWWGVQMNLDAYLTGKLEAVLAGGAGVAEVVSLLLGAGGITAPAALVTGLAAATLAIGAATVAFCSNSRGIKIYKPYVGPFYCTGG
jgi:chitodextrinase